MENEGYNLSDLHSKDKDQTAREIEELAKTVNDQKARECIDQFALSLETIGVDMSLGTVVALLTIAMTRAKRPVEEIRSKTRLVILGYALREILGGD